MTTCNALNDGLGWDGDLLRVLASAPLGVMLAAGPAGAGGEASGCGGGHLILAGGGAAAVGAKALTRLRDDAVVAGRRVVDDLAGAAGTQADGLIRAVDDEVPGAAHHGNDLGGAGRLVEDDVVDVAEVGLDAAQLAVDPAVEDEDTGDRDSGQHDDPEPDPAAALSGAERGPLRTQRG